MFVNSLSRFPQQGSQAPRERQAPQFFGIGYLYPVKDGYVLINNHVIAGADAIFFRCPIGA